MLINNKYKFERLFVQLQKGINLVGLQRLNPIFKYPVYERTKGGVMVIFPDSERELILRKAISDIRLSAPVVNEMFFSAIPKPDFTDTLLWIVESNIVVCYSYKVEDNINKPYARYFLFEEAPSYIQELASPALKLYKNCMVTILDNLPLTIRTTVSWDQENHREGLLNSIADFLNAQELIEVNHIIEDKDLSPRAALDKIVKLRGFKIQLDLSYCLTCDKANKGRKKFCNSSKDGYENKNNCLTKFNYWLKARLGIKTTESISRIRNQLCKEMVELTKDFPLSAYEEFRRRHPKLYEKRYKARWERERRVKQ